MTRRHARKGFTDEYGANLEGRDNRSDTQGRRKTYRLAKELRDRENRRGLDSVRAGRRRYRETRARDRRIDTDPDQ